jgi:hypothetical protein
MSAFLCDDDTFDLIASFAVQQHRDTNGDTARLDAPDLKQLIALGIIEEYDPRIQWYDGQQIGAILHCENVRSLGARYGSNAAESWDLAAPYIFRQVAATEIDPVVVLKSIACLQYQSCEADDYEKTIAYALLMRIERAAIRAIPGYEAAPWGWTRPRPSRLSRVK